MAADSKAKFLQEAERFVLHGRVQQAIGEYLKIVKFDPNEVLILNTVGDLYLRQGNIFEANKCFSQVAENYVQNNFFLKAIAVYKKILSADPDNLDINATMASLYARQGLSVDARNQYLRVATLLETDGRTGEQMEAYEKVVDLDPKNSAIQSKLAEMYLAEGAQDKALAHWLGAAHAQAKASDYTGAADSYGRAMQLNPLDIDAMRGFLECCLKLNNPGQALDQIKKAVDHAPDHLDLRELLVQAYLANNDLETALKTLLVVLSMDESRYEGLFAVAKAFLHRNDFDRAATCLDEAIPTLISRREADRALKLYHEILQRSPGHIVTMEHLASVYSSIGDHTHHLAMMDEIADYHVQKKNLNEAIGCLEKILHINPTSEKHQKLHRRVFLEAFPNTPYVPPAEPPEAMPISAPILENRDGSDLQAQSEIVEVDLLLNYGLREKALGLLHSLEARDPYDREVRIRLLSFYRGEKNHEEAAKQSLLLAVLHRRSNNEEAALSCLAEARQLSPEVAENEKNLDSFARMNGIESEIPASAPPAPGAPAPEPEVDLSSDLLDIFFSGQQEPTEEYRELTDDQEETSESLPESIAGEAASKSVEEQLQEVDFYLRLGFEDEALTKLNQIARVNPDNPELDSRYEKLGKSRPAPAARPETKPGIELDLEESTTVPDAFADLEFEDVLEGFADDLPRAFSEAEFVEFPTLRSPDRVRPRGTQAASPLADFGGSATAYFQANQMFADLMEGADIPPDDEVMKESFEDHFSLGTAYRDMDLNDEAVREFQFALKIADLKREARQVIQCCGMLSTCFLKKGMPSSALRWCQTGLKVQDISSHETMALRYDMGVAHSMSGSKNQALECFDQIFGLDPAYRDVAHKIDELRVSTGPEGGFDRHAP